MEMFQKAPSVETNSLRKPQFPTTRGLYNLSYTVVTLCNTNTPATDTQFSFQYDS